MTSRFFICVSFRQISVSSVFDLRMIRRFAYIAGKAPPSGICSLHRLDISERLFYQSPAAADTANKSNGNKIPKLPRLPPPIKRIRASQIGSAPTAANMELMALLNPRRSEDMIIFGDSGGRTLVYNANSRSYSTVPHYNSSKGLMPATFSIARPDAPLDDLYVLGSSSFDVLSFSSRTWRWEALPPPFAGSPTSHTVVDDGKTICVSAFLSCGTTFCFDTVEREWWQPPVDWAPPFVGKAEYLPDLKVWLGLASHSYKLCAWDLFDMNQPPVLLSGGGEADVETPEDWAIYGSYLLNLGELKFCVVKVFHTRREFDGDLMGLKYGVLTGVEVVPGSGDKIERIVRHKSLVHPFYTGKFNWVL